jgi:hypothetical protein
MMIRAPFRMPQDDGAGAGVRQHFRRNIARVRTEGFGMAILTADGNAGTLRSRGKACNQGCGWTNHQVGFAGERPGSRDDLRELSARGGSPVHFPIARNERNYFGRHQIPFRVPLSAPWTRTPISRLALLLQGARSALYLLFKTGALRLRDA